MESVMEYLQHFLPTSYKYKVIEFSQTSKHEEEFNAMIRANINSKEDAESWLKDFENLNKVNFRVIRTYSHGESKLVFKKDYRCHQNTRASLRSSKTKTPSTKHVNCPAFLRITVKKRNMQRSRDELLHKYPSEITIKHNHNHSLEHADSLRHRKPTKETEEKILELFAEGYSPSTALDLLKSGLQEEYGDEYARIAKDRALCPNLQWVFRKYYTRYKKKFGASGEIYANNSGKIEGKIEAKRENSEIEVKSENTEIEAENENSEIDAEMENSKIKAESENSEIEAESDERVISVEQNLQRVFHKLLQDMREDPHILDASEKFIRNFDNIRTKSAFVYSLRTFGKRRFRSTRRMNTVKPTSAARRKVYVGGRNGQQAGRPAKPPLTAEYDDCSIIIVKDNGEQWLVPLKRRKTSESEPHSLSSRVE